MPLTLKAILYVAVLSACDRDDPTGPSTNQSAVASQPVPGEVILTICDEYPLTAIPDCLDD